MPHDAEPLTSLAAYIRGLADRGELPALIEHSLYRGVSYSYRELMGRAFAFQAELGRRGVRAGDRVMLWGASGAAWAIAYYGCVLAQAVLVPLDAGFSESFAGRVLGQTEAVLLVTDHDHALATPSLPFEAVLALAPAPPPPPLPDPDPQTLLEIVYTSGATADPKGVMITHGNLLANLRPIAREVGKYKPKAWIALPLRFLHLIPLSHLFGQVMGLMIPPMLDSAVIFPESQSPAQWARLIKAHRASVMVAVPQQLQILSQWAAAEVGLDVEAAAALGRNRGIAWSWWHFRKLHRTLGWKMWAFIVGGAALPPLQEDFWNCMGYAMIQGYGLTETAPAIAITHPFKIRRGAVGRMLAGVETRLSPSGEILVRGGNVSPGYYRNPEATRQSFDDGWLHTGDLGRLDEEGNLHFLGRIKEVIVTPDGLNVYPEDVERALSHQAAVAECAVVEQHRGGVSQVHAVIVPRPEATPAAVEAAVAAANAALEPHQRIRASSLWPQPALPRTASTRKLQRLAIARWVNQNGHAAPEAPVTGVHDWRTFMQERWGIAADRLQPAARLDADLGLSSLDRVELSAWIEAHTPGAMDEFSLAAAQTVADMDALAAPPLPPGAPHPSVAPTPALAPPTLLGEDPGWPLHAALRPFRALAFTGLVFPFLRTAVTRLTVEGRERFDGLPRPVLFVANHQSLLDVPAILKALPRRWRPWLAPAMGVDPVADALNPNASAWRRARARWRFFLLRVFFNAYLLTDRGAIARALRHSGRLADRGFCPLIFPEGQRGGAVRKFRPGIGVFVSTLRLPVMVIRIQGLHEILPAGARHARPGRATVQFGPVFHFGPHLSAEEITAKLESWFNLEP